MTFCSDILSINVAANLLAVVPAHYGALCTCLTLSLISFMQWLASAMRSGCASYKSPRVSKSSVNSGDVFRILSLYSDHLSSCCSDVYHLTFRRYRGLLFVRDGRVSVWYTTLTDWMRRDIGEYKVNSLFPTWSISEKSEVIVATLLCVPDLKADLGALENMI